MAEFEGTAAEDDDQPEPDSHTDPRRRDDYLDEQEEESFPASDPHSDWSGPA